ncbi:DUF3443 family protein [Geobacter sp. AOG1]|uniref:DUF3443 family protein n=1 Tax=Geobacter sp. AOG1 TaxID=1566346 RepID=UPI001CC6E7E1|nr:DUF3443 family protein [Geobacter sp. AOG1]GFE56828.1 Gly/Ala/Ser-rich lipoprotein [Geobacter sp. AOG1]
MRSSNVLFLALWIVLVAGCGGGGSGGGIVGGGGGTKSLVSIAITPSNPSIAVATTQQFTATGAYSDNTKQDLTASVTWSSSNTSVATIVGTTGLATSVAIGSTTITAALGGISGTTTLTVSPGSSANNVLAISVKDSPSSTFLYPNKPTVSVTICTPGTSTCQTINDILLDTGSYGLRIFSQILTVPLTQVTVGAGALAECVQFVDGTADWGPVQLADVILGGEPAVRVPVHVFNAAFGAVPPSCGIPEASPAAAGYNGILGVGLFTQDCGSGCVTSPLNGIYYSCSGTNCTGTTAPLTSQVQNPVALLPQDNNGVLVQLPGIPAGGAPSVAGSLVLGIGTQANNTPSGVTAYPVNPLTGDFATVFGGTTFTSFIDSGSNGLFFSVPAALAGQLPVCASPNTSWFCPPSTVSFTATNSGYLGSPSGPVSFQIGNSTTLFSSSNILSSGNNAFAELGGPAPSEFDWGLPFFYGRSVFTGIEGKTSSLGSGPYWAY